MAAEEIVTAKIVFQNGMGPSPLGTGGGVESAKQLKDLNETMKKTLTASIGGLTGGSAGGLIGILGTLKSATAITAITSIVGAVVGSIGISESIKDWMETKFKKGFGSDLPAEDAGFIDTLKAGPGAVFDALAFQDLIESGNVEKLAEFLKISQEEAQTLVDNFVEYEEKEGGFVDKIKGTWGDILGILFDANKEHGDSESLVDRETSAVGRLRDMWRNVLDLRKKINDIGGGGRGGRGISRSQVIDLYTDKENNVSINPPPLVNMLTEDARQCNFEGNG